MKKINIILALISVMFVGAAFAGPDALVALGIPQTVVSFLPGFPAGVTGAILLAITPQETGLVIAYGNKALVADQVMPVVPLQQLALEFKWYRRTLGDTFTAKDNRVGRLSSPRRVDFSGEVQTAIAEGFGFDSPVPYEDINQLTPEARTRLMDETLVYLTNLNLLSREARVAAIVQDAANYKSDQVKTCAAADQIGTNDDVFGMISEMLDDAVVRPNRIGMNQQVFTKLRSDKSIVSALYPNGNGTGVVSAQQLAELFLVDTIIVGQARINTNKDPKNPSLENCWGKHLWAHYYEPLTNTKSGIAWGYTAQVGDRIASSRVDMDAGLQGSEILRSGAYQKDLVAAPAAGLLIKDILA